MKAKLAKQILTFTPSAIRRIKWLLDKNKKAYGLLLDIKYRGCSGKTYKMDYAEKSQIQKFDEVVTEEDIKVVVKSRAVLNLIGTEIDYKEDEISSKFIFNNPNVDETCGCGESFHTKKQ